MSIYTECKKCPSLGVSLHTIPDSDLQEVEDAIVFFRCVPFWDIIMLLNCPHGRVCLAVRPRILALYGKSQVEGEISEKTIPDDISIEPRRETIRDAIPENGITKEKISALLTRARDFHEEKESRVALYEAIPRYHERKNGYNLAPEVRAKMVKIYLIFKEAMEHGIKQVHVETIYEAISRENTALKDAVKGV
ncbi:MAG: hypothetical protein OEV93_01945 [Candidatus Moranbacteria bacterium]|nr:hypothetical protein [Candidatus Moranbacteria bacterium]